MNKKPLYALALFAFTMLSGCSILKPKPLLQPEKLLRITALDLSEDKSTLSTQNDEILVSIFFGSAQGDNWFFNGYHLEPMVFDKEQSSYSIDSVDLSTEFDCDDCVVFICLTEIDTDGSEDSTHLALENLLNTIGYMGLDSKSIVDAALPDNDFLGVVKLPYFEKKMATEFTISGKDLLDKYAYQLLVSNKPKNIIVD